MTVTIITASYNKPDRLREAAESVFAQTHKDWRWEIVLDGPTRKTQMVFDSLVPPEWGTMNGIILPTGEQRRKDEYRPAVIANERFDACTAEYCCWLSDDDLLHPDYLTKLVDCCERTPAMVAYCGVERIIQVAGGWKWECNNMTRGFLGTEEAKDWEPFSDGGSMLWRTEAWQRMGWRFPTGWDAAPHADQLLMRQFAQRWGIHDVCDILLTHRYGYESTHQRATK